MRRSRTSTSLPCVERPASSRIRAAKKRRSLSKPPFYFEDAASRTALSWFLFLCFPRFPFGQRFRLRSRFHSWCRATRGMTIESISEFDLFVPTARFPAFAFAFCCRFCRSHPPPPAPVKTRILTSRAVVNKRTCWRVGQSPSIQHKVLRARCKHCR